MEDNKVEVIEPVASSGGEEVPQEAEVHKEGYLKLDATVADQMIVYPTDLGLLNRCREESERLIDILYRQSEREVKPRTYRRLARWAFVSLVKSRKKRRNRRLLRRAIGQQLRYVRRNLQILSDLLDEIESRQAFVLRFRDLKIYWVIQHIYAQQKQMYILKVNRCDDRIVNIYQPYVRPIKRGKERVDVEFGAKLGVSEFNGFSRINHLSWDAYNESADLKEQVEAYKTLWGHYPAVVLIDQIYLTRENRSFLKEKGIRHCGVPLGRPKEQTAQEKQQLKKERAMRNHIEGKFGQGKNAYGLREIRARRRDTSQSWLGGIFLAMNVVALMKVVEKVTAFILLAVIALLDIFLRAKIALTQTRIAQNISGYKVLGRYGGYGRFITTNNLLLNRSTYTL